MRERLQKYLAERPGPRVVKRSDQRAKCWLTRQDSWARHAGRSCQRCSYLQGENRTVDEGDLPDLNKPGG